MLKKTHTFKKTMVKKGFPGLFVFSAFIHVEDQRRRRAAFEGGFFERGIVYEPKQTLMMAMTIVLIIAMMIVLMIIIVMMIDVKIMKNIIINQSKLPFKVLKYFQLAKMFIVVLIVFGLCWLPYHAYFFYTYYHVVRLLLQLLS